jgi:CMP-N-acetylneuraminic acid synthetase
VPGKNIRLLANKPLITHTIEQAQECSLIDEVYVSSDDKQICAIGEAAGAKVPFVRPAELAGDNAPKIPVIQHLVDHIVSSGVTVDRIVDLDPTSPLRTLEDIEAAIELLDADTDNVITAYPADKNPYFNMVQEMEGGGYKVVCEIDDAITRRQDAPQVYSMNASIYVWWKETLGNSLFGSRTKLYVMPRERSIDIDSDIDFKLVELLLAERG